MHATKSPRNLHSAALWNPYRRVSLRGRTCANTLQPRSAQRKTRKRPSAIFWFYGEIIRTSVHDSHNVIVEAQSSSCHRAYFVYLRGTIAVEARRRRAASASISIYKEELKTVVRELLVCTQPNRHETSTALWNPYRRVSLRGRRAQIRFSRGARGEKPENDRPPFWFYGEGIRTSVRGSHKEAPS